MSPQSGSRTFAFNDKIDKAFIFSLYEDDYLYVSEVFGTSLESLQEDLAEMEHSFRSSNLADLKRAVHKIKPVFGFTGLLDHQEKIGLFEQQASTAGNIDAISHEFDELLKVVRDGKRIIEDEQRRLIDFI